MAMNIDSFLPGSRQNSEERRKFSGVFSHIRSPHAGQRHLTAVGKPTDNLLPIYARCVPEFPSPRRPPWTRPRKERRKAPLTTPTDLGDNARRDISGALNALLADVFALYLKTKNFHWHVSGPHFRDYHLLFDEQGDQIFAITDEIAERVRKVGGTTLHSIGNIARLQRIPDNDADYVDPLDMLAELQVRQPGADREHARGA